MYLVHVAIGGGGAKNPGFAVLSVYRNVGAGSELLYRHTGWQPTGALLERLVWEAETRVRTERTAAELPVSQV